MINVDYPVSEKVLLIMLQQHFIHTGFGGTGMLTYFTSVTGLQSRRADFPKVPFLKKIKVTIVRFERTIIVAINCAPTCSGTLPTTTQFYFIIIVIFI